jgi:hypothetical protein
LTYADYRYEDSFASDSAAGVVSGKLSVETIKWNNLYSKASFTTVQGIDHDADKQSTTYIFNPDGESFSLLEEVYLGYTNSMLDIKLGRQEITTPYIDSDDYFVTPNGFEAITLRAKPIEELVVDAGHVTRMSGTWDSGYDGSTFNSMSRQSLLPSGAYDIVGNQAVSYLGGTYTRDAHKLQLWDFYAHEMFNTAMVQYDYETKNYNVALQYSMKREVGKLKDSSAYKVHYDVYGARIGATVTDKWNLDLAYTGVSDDDSSHAFGSWGGYCEFASGMGGVSYFETSLRDANIYALTTQHKLSGVLKGLSFKMRYAFYDLNPEYTVTTDAVDGYDYMHAYGAQVNYDYSKELTFKVSLAGRELDGGNRAQFFRIMSKYAF